MSSTTQISLSITHTPSTGLPVSISTGTLTATPAGDRHTKGRNTTNSTAGTDNAVPFGVVPTAGAGRGFIRNLSLTDTMDLSWTTGVGFAAFETIPAGLFWTGNLRGQLYIKCAAASQPYDALIIEA
jgi:hypothetical protein